MRFLAYYQMDIFNFLLLSNAILYSLYGKFSFASDTITLSQTLNDSQTLVSGDGTFEMGFFSPGTSGNRYLGMWYKNIPDRRVVWVANRVNPINDSSGIMMLNWRSGNLEIRSHNMNITVWSANSTKKLESPIAQLLDSGNLVLRNERDGDNPDLYAWQSFDYPSDTLLAGMKLGWDSKSGINRRLTAWKNPNDPSPGVTMMEMELSAYPELVLWKGSQKRTRNGPWIGERFGDVYEVHPHNMIFDFKFVHTEDEIYYVFHIKNKSVVPIPVVNESKYTRDGYVWIEGYKTWELHAYAPRDDCAKYSHCGNYGICSIDDVLLCKCLGGFTPKSPARWEYGNYSDGCVRIETLDCSIENEFVKVGGLKLPDTEHTWLNESMNLEECKAKCLSNCSCVAYTNSDIRNGGSGCAIWFVDLIDIRQLKVDGQDLYIRMPFSHSGVDHGSKTKRRSAIVAAIAFSLLVALIACYCICKRKTNLREKAAVNKSEQQIKEDIELPVFDLAVIVEATRSFSIENKLGEGGFGSVYKGTLQYGQQIAVKRLSRSSGQGQNEFKNEMILIAKLQHRNLVKLLDCYMEGTEKMLIYEFMPNGSLDHFIFDQTSSTALDWPKRFTIICGIARGLLYLHHDSRLRIIHRDLKASNVLLDNEMNPKISDFGMARSFGGDQTEGNTRKIAGTYGYMAPEYAISGNFSVKSDVYSFGVLLLEIVSGKRNRGFDHEDRCQHLVELAWIMWTENRPLQLIDETITGTCSLSEVMRCIHVALLCVQQHPRDRPSMTSVVLMLGSENELPLPNEPAIFRFSNKDESISMNEVTITTLEAR